MYWEYKKHKEKNNEKWEKEISMITEKIIKDQKRKCKELNSDIIEI